MTAWSSLDSVGALALAPMLLLCITQWLRFDRARVVAELQALTPHVLALAVPLAVVATLNGNTALAAMALVPLATLLVLALPIVVRMDTPPDAPTALVLGVVNLLGDNPTPELAATAIARHDADVWVLVEATHALAGAIHTAMGNPALHRSEILDEGTNGIAVWSRWPITAGGILDMPGRRIADVVVTQGDISVRVIALHTHPPTQGAHPWVDELQHVGDLAADGTIPTVIAGDFNAARWHPSFRRLLRRGWVSTHEAVGKGWSASWPADRRGFPPPFVRLDHALVNRSSDGGRLAPLRVVEIAVPGSDHIGFVADYAFSSSAANPRAARRPRP
jgi:endonuclease/exonuclease/phosphatase (EEP) superfamily protein YafD